MFSFLLRRQSVFRLQIRTLSSFKAGVPNVRETGVVKRFSKGKGFGFIKQDSNGNDVFVHFQSILGAGFKTLEEGQAVEFNVSEGAKGLEARNVTVRDQTLHISDNQLTNFNLSTKDRYTGIVRKLVKNRGFGFITRKSDGADIFMPSRSIRPADLEMLQEGMEVDFLAAQSDRGIEAKNVRPIKNTSSAENAGEEQNSDRTATERGAATRETGTVSRWNKERGFGFVRRTSNGKDVFVHAKSLSDGLQAIDVGQEIQFRVQSTGKGEEACDVRLVTNEQDSSLPKK